MWPKNRSGVNGKTPSKRRVIVIGSVGYGGMDRIRKMYKLLDENGFEVMTHPDRGEMDYSDIEDFRSNKALAKRIVEKDLRYIADADIIVVLGNSPSWGTAIEMYYGLNKGKKIVLLAKEPIPTPWPICHADYVVESEDELLRTLKGLK